jgi:peptidoglycan/LPS O-acetylase OafA/YrhL
LVAGEDILGVQVTTNTPNPLPMAVLACTIIAGAYTMPKVTAWLLRGNDVSYGVYIYHGVVLNAFLAIGMHGTVGTLVGAVAIALTAAIASWVLVERPALKTKRNPLHPVGKVRHS